MGTEEFIELVADRAEVIDALTGEPLGLREIVDSVGASRSTVNRAVRALEDEGLVERTGDGYVATLAGRVALDRYREYRETVADLRAVEPALAGLPPETDLDSAIVRGADVTLGDDATPYEPEERLHETVADADAYTAVLPAVEDPRHVGFLYEHVVTDDDPATLVVDDPLRDHLASEFPRRLAAMADAGRFELLVGETPPFGLVVTDHGDERRVSVLVYGDGGVHAVLENDADHALDWAEAVLDGARESAQDATDSVRQSADGGVVAGDAAAHPGDGLLVDLEREGFVRLSPAFFADRRVADPTTAWRAGLDLAEVHAGYAVARTREDDTTLTDYLVDRLAAGDQQAVVGPPGSGKSTTCKRVACQWYDEGRGPVFYREGGHGQPFESVESLVATAEAADGHALVVVEDAVRPDAEAVFAARDRLADRDDVSFLLDAREHEWRDAAVDRQAVDVVTTPRLLGRDCERLVEHFERTVDADVDVPLAELRESVRDEAVAGESAPSETLLLLDRLARYADPLADGETRLEAVVADCYGDLAAAGEAVVDAGVLVNVLNLAGFEVTRDALEAGVDDAAAVDRAVELLEGRALFERDDGTYRTVHEAWSSAFLAHHVEAVSADRASERFGRTTSRLLATLAGRDDSVSGAEVPARSQSPMTGERAVRAVFAVGTRYPKLAPLFGDGPDGSVRLPESVDLSEEWALHQRARMVTNRGDAERGVDLYERLADRTPAPAPDADEARARRHVEARLGLAEERHKLGDTERAVDHVETAARGAAQLDAKRLLARAYAVRAESVQHQDPATARDYFEWGLAFARAADDRTGELRCLLGLGLATTFLADYETAREYTREGLDIAQAIGDRDRENKAWDDLGIIHSHLGDPDRAVTCWSRSLEIARELGDRGGEAAALTNVATTRLHEGNYEAAAERYRAALEVCRQTGCEQSVTMPLLGLGKVSYHRGDYDEAVERIQEGRERARESGEGRALISGTAVLAELRLAEGDHEAAAERAQETVERARQAGAVGFVSAGKRVLGRVEDARGNAAAAERLLAESHRLAARIGHDLNAGRALAALGEHLVDRADRDTAGAVLSEAVDRLQSANAAREAVDAMTTLGDALATEGDDEAAREWFDRALDVATDHGFDAERDRLRARLDDPSATEYRPD